VIKDNDSVPWRKKQEGFDFTSCEGFFRPSLSRREIGSRLPQRAGSLAGRRACAGHQAGCRLVGDTALSWFIAGTPTLHRRAWRHIAVQSGLVAARGEPRYHDADSFGHGRGLQDFRCPVQCGIYFLSCLNGYYETIGLCLNGHRSSLFWRDVCPPSLPTVWRLNILAVDFGANMGHAPLRTSSTATLTLIAGQPTMVSLLAPANYASVAPSWLCREPMEGFSFWEATKFRGFQCREQ
jgi:hypothetical protein